MYQLLNLFFLLLISSTIQEYLTKYGPTWKKMSCLVSAYCYLNIIVAVCQLICLFEIIKVDGPQNALLNVYVSYGEKVHSLVYNNRNMKIIIHVLTRGDICSMVIFILQTLDEKHWTNDMTEMIWRKRFLISCYFSPDSNDLAANLGKCWTSSQQNSLSIPAVFLVVTHDFIGRHVRPFVLWSVLRYLTYVAPFLV